MPGLVIELDGLGLAVGLAGVDLLAGLLDGAEDGLVVEPGLGDHQGLLLVERDVVALDACTRGADQPMGGRVSLRAIIGLGTGHVGNEEGGREIGTALTLQLAQHAVDGARAAAAAHSDVELVRVVRHLPFLFSVTVSVSLSVFGLALVVLPSSPGEGNRRDRMRVVVKWSVRGVDWVGWMLKGREGGGRLIYTAARRCGLSIFRFRG